MVMQEYDFSRCDYTLEETQKYLLEVIKSRYNDVLVHQIIDALAIAKDVHSTQLRAEQIPYIVHPMRVALLLIKFEKNTTSKLFIAALLHDTLEKTNMTFLEIEHMFGRYVAKLVQSVTRAHDEMQSHQQKTWAKRQNWQEVMSGSHEARAIKTFEDLDNIIYWKVIPEGNSCQKKIPRWLAEAREMSLPLAHATNMEAYNLMRQEYEFYVKQGFADQPITI